MTKRQLERYLRAYVLPRFPNFEVRGGEMFAVPIGLVHRAIVFSRARWDAQAFSHIYVATIPLWQVLPALSLSYSDDVLRGDEALVQTVNENNVERYFNAVCDRVGEAAERRFSLLGDPAGVLRNLRSFPSRATIDHANADGVPDIAREDTLAGAEIICGDLDRAGRCIDNVLKWIAGDDRPWVVDKKSRLVRLRQSLVAGRAAAIKELQLDEAVTIRNLQIQQFMDPVRWTNAGQKG